ncbi:hypothetical protein EIP86_000993 [Pleurotus ostreatoroseus]|nr:hypothetical protein EIP86_000993 [Pleurotus ostreatoroseus]
MLTLQKAKDGTLATSDLLLTFMLTPDIQKCDGAKPACQQCVRAKKSEGCEYDDGKGKTRTQLMREHIARLEQRIKELESAEQTSPPVTLFDPHTQPSPYFSESSSSSSHDSPGAFTVSASASPVPFIDGETPSWEDQWASMAELVAASPIPEPYNSEEPPVELAQMLLEIFLPHRHQVGLEIHAGRLRESLSYPMSERRHPVLMNAIYLWACYLSRPGSLSEHEQLYLSRALTALNDAIANPSSVVDLIQASCLLSIYFMTNGRLVEGSYHASAAASLAIQWGLHQIGSPEIPTGVITSDWGSTFRLEPAKDSIEEGERICAFWQAYVLDRCWSVALQRPCVMPDSTHIRTTITTPWPQPMEEYEAGEIDFGDGSPTIESFFARPVQTAAMLGGFSAQALRAKASALLDGAYKLSSSWSPRLAPPNNFTENFSIFEHTITRFTTTLLPLHQLQATMPDDKYMWYMIHSLAHTAMIRLHQPFIQDDQHSRDMSIRAARAVVVVTKHIADADYDYLNPLIGVSGELRCPEITHPADVPCLSPVVQHCWVSAARVLVYTLAQMQIQMQNQAQGPWSQPLNTAEVRGELATLLFALTKLSTKFPLLGYEAAKMQKLLDSA